MTTRAEILIIGNEILSGKVPDEHAGFLCREFRALGVDVRRVVVLPDDVEAIAQAVRDAWGRSDVIVSTGGIGPTHDDVTIAGIASGLGRPVVRHPHLEGIIREVYGDRPSAAISRLAEVPEGAELISADGLRVPVVKVEKLYIFPGVPQIFRRKFHAIKSRFQEAPFRLERIYLTTGEETIASLLNDVVRKFPDLLLGSYPVVDRPEYRVMLTLESKNAGMLRDAHAYLLSLLPSGIVVRLPENQGAGS
jgi:molybdenum cofactor synthesis domain-containing protein